MRVRHSARDKSFFATPLAALLHAKRQVLPLVEPLKDPPKLPAGVGGVARST